jgi:hypothetical protein
VPPLVGGSYTDTISRRRQRTDGALLATTAAVPCPARAGVDMDGIGLGLTDILAGSQLDLFLSAYRWKVASGFRGSIKTTCHCGREYRFANPSGTVLLGQDYLKGAVCCDLKGSYFLVRGHQATQEANNALNTTSDTASQSRSVRQHIAR